MQQEKVQIYFIWELDFSFFLLSLQLSQITSERNDRSESKLDEKEKKLIALEVIETRIQIHTLNLSIII
jgi:hypothetical protein